MINPAQALENKDILSVIFGYCSVSDNVKNNAAVCKVWRDPASAVAKKQLIALKIEEIEHKAAKFLELVPEKLEFYCPTYANLLKMDLKAHSIKQVHGRTLRVIEKHPQNAFISSLLRVSAEDPNIPDDRREWLAGKTFVRMSYYKNEDGEGIPCIWPKEAQWSALYISFLPIELFNLTVCGAAENYAVNGDLNKGTVCFAYRGKLIEFELYNGTRVSHDNYYGIVPIPNYDHNQTIPLVAEGASEGHIWPHDFYIAKLHAK